MSGPSVADAVRRRPGGAARPWLRILTPLYRSLVLARLAGYRRGLLRTERLPVPVVSVGNLTFGGTGKTPTVIALARDLVRRGRRPAILTRGYGRRGSEPLVALAPDPRLAPERYGDEPIEIAERLPGVPVVVDFDRIRGGHEAVRHGADVLLLDDGFQHLRVARDLDVVLLDAGDPWGGDRLPPAGRLREPVAGIARADLVVVTKIPQDEPGAVAAIAARLADLAPGRPLLAAALEPWRVAADGAWHPPDCLAGRRVFAFAGLGRPGGFLDSLVRSGAVIAGSRFFGDHHHYTAADLAAITAAAHELRAVPITTRKDAVKLDPTAPVWVLEVVMTPLVGSWDPLWQQLDDLGS